MNSVPEETFNLLNEVLIKVQDILNNNTAHTRYFDEFFRLKCAPDILLSGSFPNAKEITESMAAYNAARRYLTTRGFQLNDPKVRCFVIGDGHSPRTGILFALRTKWTIISVDPSLRMKSFDIDRLYQIKSKIEDADLRSFNGEKSLIVQVHSHAKAKTILDKIKTPIRAFIDIPCCVPESSPNDNPRWEYIDHGIHSPKNKVKIWERI